MIGYGMIWYDDMICYDMIWYDIWYDVWYDMTYDMIYDMIWYNMIYIYLQLGWHPVAVVHIYKQTIHRTTQTKKYKEQPIIEAKQYIEQHSYYKRNVVFMLSAVICVLFYQNLNFFDEIW